MSKKVTLGYERYSKEALSRHLYFLCYCLYGKVRFKEFADICVGAWLDCESFVDGDCNPFFCPEYFESRQDG